MKPNLKAIQRPGLRALVLGVSAALVVGTAVLVSINVSDHLQRAAVNEAVRTTEAVVRGYIDPSVADGGLADPTPAQAAAIDADLVRLVSAGKILRIKVWSLNGTVVFSDLPALRGRQFPLDDDLSATLQGNVSTSFSNAADVENIFERGLADQFLSIYLPIHSPANGPIVGAYEVYEDAAPIEAEIARTSQDVEDAGQLSELRMLGADLGQGFLFAKPLPPTEIAAMLADPGGWVEDGPAQGVA